MQPRPVLVTPVIANALNLTISAVQITHLCGAQVVDSQSHPNAAWRLRFA